MIYVCKLCGKKADHRHHLFSQTVWARKLYKNLLEEKSNIIFLCADCHLNKPIPKKTEKEFCDDLGIKVRSKTGR